MRSRSELAESWVFTPFWQNPGEIDSGLRFGGLAIRQHSFPS